MLYSLVKFQLIVIKPYNYNPNIDNPKDIVYTEGPACPSRLKVRIPATPAPLAVIIPIAEILSIIPIVAIL